MTLAVTLMIRDEADILPDWLNWHVAQGVDVFVITDNGSVDGTTAMLEDFARTSGLTVDLRHDPVHRKQQGETVTAMARAAARLGADWVVNADADEFLVPKDRSLTLGDVFARLDPGVRAFIVPVVNLVGPLAERGASLDRLVWRDERSPEQLREVGLLAQPTGNAVHVGDEDVTVVQGNHLVSIAAGDPPPVELELEVLHVPWRSWSQYRHRTEVTGLAYEANHDVEPSPRHHGMRDYRRLGEGTLRAHFALRHVHEDDVGPGFRRDTSLADVLRDTGVGVSGAADELVPRREATELALLGRALVRRDAEIEALGELRPLLEGALSTADELRRQLAAERAQVARLEAVSLDQDALLEAFRARRSVRDLDALSSTAGRLSSRLRR